MLMLGWSLLNGRVIVPFRQISPGEVGQVEAGLCEAEEGSLTKAGSGGYTCL